jgi:hypothetical protein
MEAYCASADDTMPLRELLTLLIHVIGDRDGTRSQQVAMQVLNHVGRALSGETGCRVMALPELRILAAGVKDKNSVVREASVRALSHSLKQFVAELRKHEEKGNVVRDISARLWVARYDVSDDVVQLADAVFEDAGLEESPMFIGQSTKLFLAFFHSVLNHKL